MRRILALSFLVTFSGAFCYGAGGGSQNHPDQEVPLRPVTVRIWNDGFRGGGGVGHASLETENSYISLWPSNKGVIKGKLGFAACSFVKSLTEGMIPEGTVCSIARGNSLLDDLDDENRAPEQIYQLRLNSAKIDKFWEVLCRGSEVTPNSLKDFGENPNKRRFVSFSELRWYIGGDPTAHEPEDRQVNLGAFVERGDGVYSCASLVLRMLVAGEIFRHCYIEKDEVAKIIPATQQDFYRGVLDEPLFSEGGAELQGAFSDAVGAAKKKLMEMMGGVADYWINPTYITPCKVGDLVRYSCLNQYKVDVPQIVRWIPTEEQINNALDKHYPQRESLTAHKGSYKKLLKADNTEAPSTGQRSAVLSYINATGRTIGELAESLKSAKEAERKQEEKKQQEQKRESKRNDQNDPKKKDNDGQRGEKPSGPSCSIL